MISFKDQEDNTLQGPPIQAQCLIVLSGLFFILFLGIAFLIKTFIQEDKNFSPVWLENLWGISTQNNRTDREIWKNVNINS